MHGHPQKNDASVNAYCLQSRIEKLMPKRPKIVKRHHQRPPLTGNTGPCHAISYGPWAQASFDTSRIFRYRWLEDSVGTRRAEKGLPAMWSVNYNWHKTRKTDHLSHFHPSESVGAIAGLRAEIHLTNSIKLLVIVVQILM